MKQIQMAVDEIRRGQGRPVYLVHGEEPWLLLRARRGIVAALTERGAIVQRFGAEADAEGVVNELVSLSLFAEQRVVVWTDCQHLARGSGEVPKRRLIEALDSDLAAHGTTLVLSAEKVDKQSKLYRRIAALGVELHYPALSPYNLGQPGRDEAYPYVEAYLAPLGRSIDSDAFRELRLRCAPDLWPVISELDRLVAYIGERRSIGLEDVVALVGHSKTDVMFDLVDAVASRDVGTALALLERLVESGTHPLLVLSTLAQNVTQIREARGLAAAGVGWSQGLSYSGLQQKVLPAVRRLSPESSLLAMHPFAAFKAFQRAQSFGTEELDELLRGLADVDLRIKTSGEDGLRALQLLLLQRVRSGRGVAARRA
jgi:DNA polymerase III delta subunit